MFYEEKKTKENTMVAVLRTIITHFICGFLYGNECERKERICDGGLSSVIVCFVVPLLKIIKLNT